jgi:hypothetical protein
MTIRIAVIAFHLLVAGLLAFCAFTVSTALYEPAAITRVLGALGALAFGFEAYTMIRDGTPSK